MIGQMMKTLERRSKQKRREDSSNLRRVKRKGKRFINKHSRQEMAEIKHKKKHSKRQQEVEEEEDDTPMVKTKSQKKKKVT